jgi:hypothetical protein
VVAQDAPDLDVPVTLSVRIQLWSGEGDQLGRVLDRDPLPGKLIAKHMLCLGLRDKQAAMNSALRPGQGHLADQPGRFVNGSRCHLVSATEQLLVISASPQQREGLRAHDNCGRSSRPGRLVVRDAYLDPHAGQLERGGETGRPRADD